MQPNQIKSPQSELSPQQTPASVRCLSSRKLLLHPSMAEAAVDDVLRSPSSPQSARRPSSPTAWAHSFKVVIVGNSAVGKTNILRRYIDGPVYSADSAPTVGVELASKVVIGPNGERSKMQIFDTAGQERFMAMTKTYYRGAHGALLVYDSTREETLHRCTRWLAELRQHADPNIAVVLVANKIDLEEDREVPAVKGKAFAKRHTTAEDNAIEFIECSAAMPKGGNVDAAFSMLHDKMVAQSHAAAATSSTASGGRKLRLTSRASTRNHSGCSC